jgi:hypothetical protein
MSTTIENVRTVTALGSDKSIILPSVSPALDPVHCGVHGTSPTFRDQDASAPCPLQRLIIESLIPLQSCFLNTNKTLVGFCCRSWAICNPENQAACLFEILEIQSEGS